MGGDRAHIENHEGCGRGVRHAGCFRLWLVLELKTRCTQPLTHRFECGTEHLQQEHCMGGSTRREAAGPLYWGEGGLATTSQRVFEAL